MPRAEIKFFAYFANDITDIFHVIDGLLHFDIDTVCIFNALTTPDKKKQIREIKWFTHFMPQRWFPSK